MSYQATAFNYLLDKAPIPFLKKKDKASFFRELDIVINRELASGWRTVYNLDVSLANAPLVKGVGRILRIILLQALRDPGMYKEVVAIESSLSA